MATRDPSRPLWRRPLLWLVAVLGLHAALLLYFAPPKVMFSSAPVQTIDYALHYYQVDRALKAWESGRLWGWDPHLLAGQPAGAIEDLSSKSLELWVIALVRLGVAPGLAFNLYILLVHLLLPLLGYAAARLLQLGRGEAVVVSLLWVLLWFFDSFLHWSWFCGMISWAASCYLVVLLVALLYRTLEAFESRTRALPRYALYLGSALCAALVALVHPFALVAAAPACLGLYARSLRRLGVVEHLLLVVAAGGVLCTASIWLLPALELRQLILDSESFLRPKVSALLYDYLDLLKEALDTGAPVRTMLRALCFVAGGITLYRAYKSADRRWLPMLLLVGGTLLFAYGGGLLWLTKQMQPYRHVGPATLGAALLAAPLLCELLRWSRLRALPRQAKLLLILALVLLTPRFVRDVLFYLPEVLIKDEGLTSHDPTRASALVGVRVEPKPFPMRHYSAPREHQKVREWLIANHRGRGRVLVQQYMLGEYLAWATDLPILGGLPERNVPMIDAHLFRAYPDGKIAPAKLREYFERYAVGFVVMTEIKRDLEWQRDLLRFRVLIEGVRIYETRIEPSYVLRGQGRVVGQAFNRLGVDLAGGADLVLRFHWLPTLRCRDTAGPACVVEPYPVPGTRVPFLRVIAPPRRFEIYNSYAQR